MSLMLALMQAAVAAAPVAEAQQGVTSYGPEFFAAQQPSTAVDMLNRIPGFTLGNHHFVPGFPQMAWPMVEWVLETRYREIFAPGSIAERSIIVTGCGESQLIDLMNDCLARYPRLKVFSLPRMGEQRHVELGVRGAAEDVPRAGA